MIGIQFHNTISTKALPNGPILTFAGLGVTQPSSTSFCSGNTATFTGVATAYFPTQTPPIPETNNVGVLTYRWYEVGVGPLSDSTSVTGTGTTILTVSNLRTPQDNTRQFFVRAEYVPPTGIAQTFVGNAINDPLDSSPATLTVFPNLSIVKQPGITTSGLNISTRITIGATTTDSRFGELNYSWTANGVTLVNGTNTIPVQAESSSVNSTTTVSGAGASTITISSNVVGIQTVQCTVSQSNACNTNLKSSVVNFSTVDARSILNYEEYNDASTTILRSGSSNLFDQTLSFYGDVSSLRNIVVYAPERNVRARITLAASAGLSNGNNRGGEGGVSIFEYLLLQNVEYIFKIGITGLNGPGGNIGGGFGSYFYEKGRVIVAVGGGGGAGASGRGGSGGGAGVSGENGFGTYGGGGGQRVSDGTLPTIGTFAGGSTYNGPNYTSPIPGRLSACTLGGSFSDIRNDYWRTRFAPCQDIGTVRYRNQVGTEIAASALISRGYKPGLSHIYNGGNASGTNGGGGSGVSGGNPGGGLGSGGGGASGYSSGDARIITSQLGGNSNTIGYLTIQLA